MRLIPVSDKGNLELIRQLKVNQDTQLDVLKQLKIINKYNEEITDEVIQEDEVET